MDIFIKNLGINICFAFYYLKFTKSKVDRNNKFLFFIMILLDSLFTLYIDLKVPHISNIIMFIILYCILVFMLKHKMVITFRLGLISFAISYAILMISAMIDGLLVFVIPYKLLEKNSQLICFVLQMLIMNLPFQIKRTKNGIEHMNYSSDRLSSVIISLFIVYLTIFINSSSLDIYGLIYYFCAFILSILLFLYWRTSITRHYLERLSLRNIDSLNAELVEKTNYIKELEEDKARIEKLNHKNYKLVPAMEGAVMHYLEGVKSFVESNADNPAFAEFAASKEMDMTGFIDEGNRLLGELNKMLAEWEDVVHNDDIDGKKDLPVCGVTRVDYILSYMYERSLKENFVLKVDVDSALTGLTEKIITDEDLGTLIADLIENAIIATRCNNGKDILVRLGMMKKEYTIEVYDSGIPFDKEVLAKYGYEQITTHADESGSGIGMMQTYEILSKCGASLFIDEFAEGEGMYTKRISVVFNKKHQYVLYTKRSDEEVAYLKKRSDLMIVRK